MRPRRGRPPPVLEGEVLGPEPSPRIRVEVVHHHYRRRHTAPPPWIIPLVFIVTLLFVSPYALVVALVLIAVFLTMHPIIAIALGGMIALVIIIAVRERLAGRIF
jgi:hypothetical protein